MEFNRTTKPLSQKTPGSLPRLGEGIKAASVNPITSVIPLIPGGVGGGWSGGLDIDLSFLIFKISTSLVNRGRCMS